MAPRKQVTYSERPTHAARAAHAKGERQFKTYDTSYIRPKPSKAPAIIALVIALAVLGAVIWGVVTIMNSCSSSQVAALPADQEATVVIEEGEGADAIGEKLAAVGLIGNATEFRNRVNELGVATQLKPGTYMIAGQTSLDTIIRMFEEGPGMDNALTIPEGSTLAETADAVAEVTQGRISADDFTAAAADASVYAADYPFLESADTNSLEGFLFPKTYEISYEATADSIIRMMLDQFGTETQDLDWSYPESVGLTLYDAVNLASIVEKECNDDDAVRAQVAAVFYNRLVTDGEPSYGKLESDATTAYEVGHEPTADEVHADTPYSTYTYAGLPPTPICSPGLACLQAVCNPDQDALGKYHFFSFDTDDAGKTTCYFSETYDEHQETFS